jgi:signal transduction histidine kinase/CheY-like chemotaxis protein
MLSVLAVITLPDILIISLAGIFLFLLIIVLFRNKDLRKRLEQFDSLKKNHVNQAERFSGETPSKADDSHDFQSKVNFFANISHEFRTPLTLILGPIDKLLHKRVKDEAQVMKLYSMMHRNALRLLRLSNQMLDTSKLDSGNLKLQVHKGDIVSYIEPIFNSFNYLADQRDYLYQFRSSHESIMGYFDNDKVEKIIYNLLSNAFKYTPRKGRIICEVKKIVREEKSSKIKCCQIIVEDSGIGISKEAIEKIFDRFYQTSYDNLSRRLGTGIGLFLTKRLIELHKGAIEVDSEITKGTIFKVEIPISKEVFAPDQFSSAPHENNEHILNLALTQPGEFSDVSAPVSPSDLTDVDKIDKDIVLIVDDYEDIRTFIRHELEDRYYVIEATDGTTAYKIIQKVLPDIVISDIMMPETDGYELCTKIKKNPYTSYIPVILLTSKAKDDQIIEGLETGADDYVTKPFNPRILRLRVDNIIESRNKLQPQVKDGLIRHKSVTEPLISDQDGFLLNFVALVESDIENTDLNVEELAGKLAMSRSQLFRKIKTLTGQGPADLIRSVKLQYAMKLIRELEKFSVSDVAYKVGFSDPKYFSKCFKKEFGTSPSSIKNTV